MWSPEEADENIQTGLSVSSEITGCIENQLLFFFFTVLIHPKQHIMSALNIRKPGGMKAQFLLILWFLIQKPNKIRESCAPSFMRSFCWHSVRTLCTHMFRYELAGCETECTDTLCASVDVIFASLCWFWCMKPPCHLICTLFLLCASHFCLFLNTKQKYE